MFFPTLEIEKFEGSSEKRGDEKTDHIITKVYKKGTSMISTKFKMILNNDIESSMITSTPIQNSKQKWTGGRGM